MASTNGTSGQDSSCTKAAKKKLPKRKSGLPSASPSSQEVEGNEALDFGNSVDFVLRTALERASSNKRPIRPKLVDASLLGSDSDDSDFQIDEKLEGNSDSESSGSDDSNSDNSKSQNSGSSSEDSAQSTNQPSTLRETLRKLNNEEQNALQSSKKRKGSKRKAHSIHSKSSSVKKPKSSSNTSGGVGKKKSGNGSIREGKVNRRKTGMERKAKPEFLTTPASGTVMARVREAGASLSDIRKDLESRRTGPKICSVCLGKKSDGSNEIVECDSCHVTVHEGCYSVVNEVWPSDASSESSSGSSSSTEPWFCDYCKRPNSRSYCILCPNTDGCLRLTAEGQFVHVVCSIYIPKLILPDGRVSLSQFPYSNFGLRSCSLCTDTRLAATGATLGCDAGLCKLFFHITCAQKLGLLSYPSTSSCITQTSGGAEADPHYVSCKAHSNKELAKSRSRVFKSLEDSLRWKREEKDENSENRVMEKLEEIRSKLSSPYNSGVSPTAAQTTTKRRRFLGTDSYSVLKFLQKVDVFGEDMAAMETDERNSAIVTNISKKWGVLPSLNLEFAAYYYDREGRIQKMSSEVKRLTKENLNLNDRQIALNTVLDNECDNLLELNNSNLDLDKRLMHYKHWLRSLEPRNRTINNIAGLPSAPQKNKPMAKKVTEMSKIPVGPPRLVLNKTCATCRETTSPHLITNCDACKKYFHLACLDPPLTRMPKRTKLCGWMCSDCCDEIEANTDQSILEDSIDTSAPRALRGRTNIKRPTKYRDEGNGFHFDSESGQMNNSTQKDSPLTPSPTTQQRQQLSQRHLIKDVSVTVEAVDYGTSFSTGRTSTRRNSGTPPSAGPSPRTSASTPKRRKAKERQVLTPSPTVTPPSQQRTTSKSVNNSPPTSKSEQSKNTSAPSPRPRTRRCSSGSSNATTKTSSTSGSGPGRNASSRSSPQQVQQNLKIVLSSLDAVGSGLKESSNSKKQTPPNSSKKIQSTSQTPPQSGTNSGTIRRQRTSSPISPGLKVNVKESSNSRNLTGQIAAAINTSSGPNTGPATGLCSVCSKLEHKRNLVECDECGSEFHFTCVPPYSPYNPKRRGYSWFCLECNEDEEAEEADGE